MSFFINNSGTGSVTSIPKSEPTFKFNNVYYLPDLKNNNLDVSLESQDYNDYYGSAKAGKIYVRYVKTGYTIVFPSILESFSDTLKPNFSNEQIYGFSDGVQKFSNTSRVINISFKLVAYDEEHARKNLYAASGLAQFMYGQYDGATLGEICTPLVLREPPMLRVRFSNMLQRTGRGFKADPTDYMAEDGLLISPTSYNFTPNIEAGFFFKNDISSDYIYPKELKLSLNGNVMHEEAPGWLHNGDKLNWIGKLNQKGKIVNENVVFPWGKDVKKPKNAKTSLQNANSIVTPSSTPTTDGEE